MCECNRQLNRVLGVGLNYLFCEIEIESTTETKYIVYYISQFEKVSHYANKYADKPVIQ